MSARKRMIGESTRRYNLVLPKELFGEIERIAALRDVKIVDVLRRFIKIGLLAEEIAQDPSASLLIREGDNEREIILL